MAIYKQGETTKNEIGKLYLQGEAAKSQVGKVYEFDGTINRLIYNSALPSTLLNGNFTADDIGGWDYVSHCYESSDWCWGATGWQEGSQNSEGLKFGIGAVHARNGGTFYSRNKLDFSGNKTVLLKVSKTSNGYFITGVGSGGDYLFITMGVVTSKGAPASVFSKIQLPAGWDNFSNQYITATIHSSCPIGHLFISAMTTDGGGCDITAKVITTTQ